MNRDDDMKHVKWPQTPAEVEALNVGDVVGDACGGQTFDEPTWAALDARCGEIQHVYAGPGTTRWTIRTVQR